MRMAGDKHCHLRKFRSQRHYGIGKIIAAGAGLESHVPRQHDRVRASSFCPRDRKTNTLDRMPEMLSTDKFTLKTKQHRLNGDINDSNLPYPNLPHNEMLDFCNPNPC